MSGTALLGMFIGLGLMATPSAEADIIGFDSGIGWTANSNTTAAPVVAGNTATMTTPVDGQTTSIFFDTAQAVEAFTATFDYQYLGTSDAPADGIALVLQNDPRGATALGAGGSSLGYGNGGGILNSVALLLNIFDEHPRGVQVASGGSFDDSAYLATGDVDLLSGHHIRAAMAYDGATAELTLEDQVTLDTFSISESIDVTGAVGGSTALVGFAGATGGQNARQTISNFSFTPTPLPTMSWNGGAGLWSGGGNWTPAGPPAATNRAVLPVGSGVVSVGAGGGIAHSLTVDAGGIDIAAGETLAILTAANFAGGTTLLMGDDATISLARGAIPAISSPPGDVNIVVTGPGGHVAGGYNDGGGGSHELRKQGPGTLTMTGITAGNSTIVVEDGTLDLTGGVDPLGGAPGVTLAGGRLTVHDQYTAGGSADDLTENFYLDVAPIQQQFIDPLGPGQGYMARVPDRSQLYSAGGDYPLDIDQPGTVVDWNTRSAGLIPAVDPQHFGAVWHGALTIVPPGTGTGDQLEAGEITVGTASDDGSTIWIDGQLVVDSNSYQGRTERTATVSLAPGDHEIYVGYYQWEADTHMEAKFGQGANLPYDDLIFVQPQHPDQAGMWSSSASLTGAFEFSGKTITVDGGGTFNPVTGSSVNVGSLLMKAGSFSTTGTTAGITFGSTTIDPGASRVGFDPQVPTDYGTIDANNVANLTIVKDGPSTWVLGAAPSNLDATASWEVAEGTLVPSKTGPANPLGGLPVKVTGGTLLLTGGDSTNLGGSAIELAGGTLRTPALIVGAVAPPGALAHWNLDESAGPTAADSAGHLTGPHDGTLVGGPQWRPSDGAILGALDFDGNDYVDAGSGIDISGSSFSFSMWTKREAWPGRRMVAMGQGPVGDSTALHVGWRSDNTFMFDFYANGLSWADPSVTDTTMYHHFAGTYDALTNERKLYMDGVEVASDTAVEDFTGIGPFYLGRHWDNSESFVGLMDEAYVYNSVLTPVEIAAMAGTRQTDFSDVALRVTDDSTVDAPTIGTASFGALTMSGGVLSTMGAKGGISFSSTTIHADATAVGFDPQVPTTFNTTTGFITVNATGPVTVSKAGSSTWSVGSPVFDGPGVGNVTWAVDGGTLEVSGAATLQGRPISAGAGGTLKIIGSGPLGGLPVTLAGGTLSIEGTEVGVVDDALAEYYWNDRFDDSKLDPIDSGAGFLTMTGTAEWSDVLRIDLQIGDDSTPNITQVTARTFGTIGNDDYGALYTGSFTVGGASPLQPGIVTFSTNSDDGSVLWIDLDQNGNFDPGELIVDNKGPHGPQTRSGSVDLAAGDYQIAIGMYEQSFGAIIEARYGQGDTATTLINPGSPAQAGLWSTGIPVTYFTAIDAGGTNLTVTADSTLAAITNLSATFGSLRMIGGVLSTTGAPDGITFSGGTTIDPAATRVGFDPQASTDYGTINANNVAGLTIVKDGPSTWTLDAAPSNLHATAHWEVAGGTLKVIGTGPLGGLPVTLAGGTFSIRAATAVGVLEDALAEYYWNALFNDPQLDPIDTGVGFLTMTGTADWSDLLRIDLQIGDDSTPNITQVTTRTLGTIGNDNYGALYAGSFTVGGASPLQPGTITFSTNSDDGSALWIDLDQNGNFDPGELIVDNKGPHGPQTRSGSVVLAAGDYQIAIGMYEQSFGAIMEARYGQGGTATTLINPGSSDQAGLWSTGDPVTYFAAIDASGTNLRVTADSTLSPITHLSATFGPLTMVGGILSTAGAPDGITFSGGTTIDPAATSVGFDLQVPTDLGVIDGSSATVTISKLGPLDLVLDRTNVNLENATFDVQEGRLIGVPSSNPFGPARLHLRGGELVLAGKTTGVPVDYDNPVVVAADSTLTAGTAGISAGAPGPLPITLGSPANGVTITEGTLTVRTTDGYALNVAGPVTASSGIEVTEGDVTFSAGGTADSVEASGGKLTLAGTDWNVDDLNVSVAAVVDTGSNQFLVAQTLDLGGTSYRTLDAGTPAFGAKSLTTGENPGDMLKATELVLNGGTVELGFPGLNPPAGATANWAFDEPPGATTAADSVGANPGTINGATPGAPGMIGTAYDFNGVDQTGDYITVPTVDVSSKSFSVGVWAKADSSDRNIFFSQGDTADCGIAMHLGYWDFDTFLFNMYCDDLWIGENTVPGADFDDGLWHHWVGTYDLTDDTRIVYMDGVEIARKTAAEGAGTFTGTGPFTIGREAFDGLGAHDGLLDDIWVYQRVLDPDEVNILFLAGTEGWQGVGALEDQDHVNLTVTQDSAIRPYVAGEAVFNDVTLANGVTFTLDDTDSFVEALSLHDFKPGDGSTFVGNLFMRGSIRPGGSVGSATIIGSVEMDPVDVGYAVDLEGAVGDVLTVQNGDVDLGGALSVQATGKLDPSGVQTRTVMQVIGEEYGIFGEFSPVPSVGSFSHTPPDPPVWSPGTYLGHGAWFGDDRTGEGVAYVDRAVPDDAASAVNITVFQALQGDTDGNRDVSFGDFNALANNYTGSLPDGTGGKEWREGDFDGDQDVDFGDFNNLANNYTGTWNWYGKKGEDAPDGAAPLDGADPQLIVDLSDGSVVMVGGPVELSGYSVSSASGSLLPSDLPLPLPLQFYLSNSAVEITAGVLGTQVLLEGSLELPWGFDAGGPKGAGDLVFSYGTSAGTFQGNVAYVVPEPGTLALLAGGLAGLLLLWRRRTRAV